MLFVLGGNGTHAGANAIHDEVFNFLSFFLQFHVILFKSLTMLQLYSVFY